MASGGRFTAVLYKNIITADRSVLRQTSPPLQAIQQRWH
jgi:hypothetical protein